MDKKQQTKLRERLNKIEIEHHLEILKQELIKYSNSEGVKHCNYLVYMQVFYGLIKVDILIAELDLLTEKSECWESRII